MRRTSGMVIPVLIGIASFLSVCPPGILLLENVDWLAAGDPATHYLGWEFFRRAAWTFPVGLNPGYGLELASSIVYSDSIPILAFIFKPFDALLPEYAQYFGFWLLLCFVGQSIYGYKLASLISTSVVTCGLVAVLLTFSPPFIWRLHGHYALAGHFLVLAALYYYFSSFRYRNPALTLLLTAAILIHAYLAVMVSGIWAASLCRDWRRGIRSTAEVALVGFAGVSFALLVAWGAGYFLVGGGLNTGGFGHYNMNLASPVTPSAGWSRLVPEPLHGAYGFEGFNYFGTGALLIILASLLSIRNWISRIGVGIRLHAELLIVTLVFAALAVTHNIEIGPYVWNVGLLPGLDALLGIFRASGRLFWPTFYTILLFAIFITVTRYRKNVSVTLLFVAASLQVYDTSAGWLEVREKLGRARGTLERIGDNCPFINGMNADYRHARMIPPGYKKPGWKDIAAFALQKKMETDAVYLARRDRDAVRTLEEDWRRMQESGRHDQDTLYFIEKSSVLALLGSSLLRHEVFAECAGWALLLPGWRQCSTCEQQVPLFTYQDAIPTVAAGQQIAFSEEGGGHQLLVRGWSKGEKWGTWSLGRKSTLVFRVKGAPVEDVVMTMRVLLGLDASGQQVNIEVNGQQVYSAVLEKRRDRIRVPLPVDAMQADEARIVRLDISLPDAIRPIDIGLNRDKRLLAIGLESISFE